MQTQNLFNAGESAISGPAQANYVTHGMSGDGAPFAAVIEQEIAALSLGAGCPDSDPLTAEAILKRASAQSCAGCHAPQKFLGADRKIGCGLVWPATLGEAHIDEHGAISPALKDVFLPKRADVLSTYLQACDVTKMTSNLQPPIAYDFF
jgi:mono/diheme cytochrome c family protein